MNKCEFADCLNQAKVRFCSISCANKAQKKKEPRECKRCKALYARSEHPKWCKDCREPHASLVEFDKLTNNGTRRKRLIKENGHRCSMCLNSEWLGKPIPLEADHIDGDHSNTRKENFRLLCPNCHAFTPTYKGKNCNRNAPVV